MKTLSNVPKKWVLVNADGRVLGRVASRVAALLRGKHKAAYTPHLDNGDYVVVVNAAKIRVTGAKLTDKLYRRHSGYAGGLKEETLQDVLRKKPTFPIEYAVKGMLPSGPLARRLLRHLKVYPGAEHPHKAQSPVEMAV